MVDISSYLVYQFRSRRMDGRVDDVWCQRQLLHNLVYLLFDLLFVLMQLLCDGRQGRLLPLVKVVLDSRVNGHHVLHSLKA